MRLWFTLNCTALKVANSAKKGYRMGWQF